MSGANPGFDRLVFAPRALARQAGDVNGAAQRRRGLAAIMAEVASLHAEGRLSRTDVALLHALRLGLDGGLLPEELS